MYNIKVQHVYCTSYSLYNIHEKVRYKLHMYIRKCMKLVVPRLSVPLKQNRPVRISCCAHLSHTWFATCFFDFEGFGPEPFLKASSPHCISKALKHAVESTRIKRTKKNSSCHLWIHGVNPYGCHIMNPVVIGAWTLTLGRPPAAAWGVVRPYPTSTRSIGNPPMACSCGLSQGAGPPPCCRLRAWAPDQSANSPSLVAYNTEH